MEIFIYYLSHILFLASSIWNQDKIQNIGLLVIFYWLGWYPVFLIQLSLLPDQTVDH